jgi:uncharacterized membrane protein
MGSFAISGLFETIAVLFMLIAFASGPVFIVSPIAASVPIWTMLLAAIFLREHESINALTAIGAVCVVAGVVAISLVG